MDRNDTAQVVSILPSFTVRFEYPRERLFLFEIISTSVCFIKDRTNWISFLPGVNFKLPASTLYYFTYLNWTNITFQMFYSFVITEFTSSSFSAFSLCHCFGIMPYLGRQDPGYNVLWRNYFAAVVWLVRRRL